MTKKPFISLFAEPISVNSAKPKESVNKNTSLEVEETKYALGTETFTKTIGEQSDSDDEIRGLYLE